MSLTDDQTGVRIGKNVTINVDKFSFGDGALIKDNFALEGPDTATTLEEHGLICEIKAND